MLKRTTMADRKAQISIKGVHFSVFQFASLLFIISSVARLAGSLYLPSLIEIGRELSLSDALLSETLTVYFLAFAVSTLFAGALADSFGRRKVIFGGVVFFISGSFLCAVAHTADILILGRVLQAAGSSCIPVTGRAMIRDVCDDKQVMSVLGWMAALGGLVPILAPMFGGLVTDTLGWRYNFWFLILFAFLVTIVIAIKLPETIADDNRQPFNIISILVAYRDILKSPEFLLVILPLEVAFGVQGAYLASSPFIFIGTYGLSPKMFGMMNILVVGALVLGRYMAVALSEKFSVYSAYLIGSFLIFLGGSALAMLGWLKIDSLIGMLSGLSIAVGGFGVLLPIGLKSVMTAFREKSGSVSALHGCVSLGCAAAGSFLFSVVRTSLKLSSSASMAWLTTAAGLVAVLLSTLSRKHLR